MLADVTEPAPFEALFLMGLPQDKLETMDGRTYCHFAFPTREEAEMTFARWQAALGRWLGRPVEGGAGPGGQHTKAVVAGWELELRRRRIDARVPVDGGALTEFTLTFWDEALWPPCGDGVASCQGFGDMKLRLFTELGLVERASEELESMHGTMGVGSRSVIVAHGCLFRRDRLHWLPASRPRHGYACGVPELVVQVLLPATRADDSVPDGRRARMLARAGVGHYWLIEPRTNELLIYRLVGERYELSETATPPGRHRPAFPPGAAIDLDALFAPPRWEVGPILFVGSRPPPDDPSMCVPVDRPIGLEHLLLAGHPAKRYEVVDDRAPCMVAFRDPRLAERNYRHWVKQAAHIEGEAEPEAIAERADIGRYHLRLDGHRVYLELDFPGELAQSSLEVLGRDDVWECDEEEESAPDAP